MRLVTRTKPGVVELNWMWAPTFVGLNTILKRELEAKLAPQFRAREMNDETLDELHAAVVDFLCEKFKVDGLREYLDALSCVVEPGDDKGSRAEEN